MKHVYTIAVMKFSAKYLWKVSQPLLLRAPVCGRIVACRRVLHSTRRAAEKEEVNAK
jgi:hypothetical protein